MFFSDYKKAFDVLSSVEDMSSVCLEKVQHSADGKWIVNDYGDYQLLQCDQCNSMMWNHEKETPNFCPNCGADMREISDNSN